MDMEATRANWKAIIDGLQGFRVAMGRRASYEDTAFMVVLSALALFAHSIAGPIVFRMAGLDDPGTDQRFRRWLDRLLLAWA